MTFKVKDGLTVGTTLVLNSSGNLTTNAATATKLQTARLLNGVSFDGTANVTIPSAAWTVASAAMTATAGQAILADTSAAAWTLTLPATPATGVMVQIADRDGTFATNNLTVARNGATIMDLAEDLLIDVTTQVALVYDGTTWKIINTGGGSGGGSGSVTLSALTAGSYLTGSAYDGTAALTWAVDAASTNTANKVVARDASGNFAAGTITAALTGNASTATILQTARTINGVSFNGSANITINAVDSTSRLALTGGTLTGALTLSGDPTADLSAVTRQWVEARMAKDSCRVATTANLTVTATSTTLTNNGTLAALSIDGITLAVNDRVLVKNQTSAAQNGIFYVSDIGSASVAWVLTRAADMDIWSDFAGALTAIEDGSTNTNTIWYCTNTRTGTLGTTAVGWQLVSNAQVAALGLLATTGVISRTGANTFTTTTATNSNTASTIVQRDASGNFSAGTITAALSGNASSATKLQTARLINGVSFDGTADITISGGGGGGALLTNGTYLTGSDYDGSAAATWAVDATSANTASKVVARDASGNFSAGTITASLNGNASTATSASSATTAGSANTLTTSRTINGVAFNGSANITIPTDLSTRTINSYTGNGSTTSYTLSATAAAAADLIVSVGGVIQQPGSAYTVSGTTITFAEAPGSTTAVWVLNLGAGKATITFDGTPYAMNASSETITGSWTFTQTINGTAAAVVGGDLAERYHADDLYQPGTVVVFGGDYDITVTSTPYDKRVAGVISTTPGYMMNMDAGEDDTHPYLALAGRVPCRVVGRVAKGDMLVTSSLPGVAQAAVEDRPLYGRIIGKALHDHRFDGEGVIEMVVMPS